MSATDTTALAGTWNLDPAHSSAGFAVKYMGVTTFRSEFKDFAANLEAADDGTASLTGTVKVESVDIGIPDFKNHLMADDFMNNTRVGIKVATKIDRTAFGLNWNAPLPKGGFALANEVTLELDLFFVKA